MSGDMYKQLTSNIIDNKLTCSESELNEYLCYGLLLATEDNYKLLNGKTITVDIYKDKKFTMNINLSHLLTDSYEKLKNVKTNKIYYMTLRCYNKYKEQGLILEQKENSYYRLYNNELWLVSLIQ